ncbi:MAG: ATP-binding cassette domain-containing protein [Myxococcales bacterium]|nr:ATP-binding cassette domain-containing protein [Myxococcales bacterium]
MTDPAAIELSGVEVRLGRAVVLRDVDLRLAAGQTHVLLGPSGCGKSTILRVLLGLAPVSAGTAQLGAKSVASIPRATLATTIGYVVQSGGLFPHLSVRRNIELSAAAQQRALPLPLESLLTRVGLSMGLAERLPAELSGGQRQRVSLARALALDPPLLLLDEPLGAVDPMLRAELQTELKALFSTTKKTVVFVTHDLAEAAWFADTVTLLNEGRVVQHGPVAALLEHPASDFVSRFLASQRSLHRLSP